MPSRGSLGPDQTLGGVGLLLLEALLLQRLLLRRVLTVRLRGPPPLALSDINGRKGLLGDGARTTPDRQEPLRLVPHV